MPSKQPNEKRKLTNLSLYRPAGVLILATVVAGCSADVVRLNPPSMDFAGSRASSQTESQYKTAFESSSLSDQSPSYSHSASPPPRANTSAASSSAQSARLSQLSQIPRDSYRPATPRQDTNTLAQNTTLSSASTRPYTSSEPRQITVQRGDTLYKIARRYNVSVSSIKRANGLRNSVIRPGQVLILAAATESAPPSTLQSERSTVATYSARTHTVQPGETLYSISRRTGIGINQLKRLNGIDDPRRLRTGQVLQLTRAGDRPLAAETTQASRRADEPATFVDSTDGNTPIILNPNGTRTTQRITEPTQRTPSPNQNSRVALNKPVAKTTSPQNGKTADENLKFRWPVTGRIIRGFGKRADGTNNDGLNIALPVGTDIKASEKGTVAYAGNELQGYGNLILIRHAKGYVTVYAHLESILAKRGDEIRRGQVIAKAGKTGTVKQPQLHFELRQGAKPIDPMPYLGRM